MTTQIQRRRGTTAQHSTFTGAVGEVTVDTDKEVLVVHDGAQVGGYPQMRENGSNSALALGSAGTPSLKFAGDTNTGIYSPGADQVAISTNGAGRLFVDASGRLLVGANSTSGASTYYDDIVVTNTTAGTGAGITLVANATNGFNAVDFGDTDATGRGRITYSHADDSLRIDTAGAERLRITSAGLVGVGTSNPSEKLSVSAGNVGVTDGFGLLCTNATQSYVQLGSGASEFGYQGTLNFRAFNVGSPRSALFLSSGGSVGIGVSGPGSYNSNANTLVVGNTSSNQGITISAGTASASAIHFADGTTGDESYRGILKYEHSNDRFLFGTAGGNTALTIDSSQRVGIGTSTPGTNTSNNANQLVIGDNAAAAERGLTIGSTTGGGIRFNDGADAGVIEYSHASNFMRFIVNATEAARFDSSGRLLVGTSSAVGGIGAGSRLQIRGNTAAAGAKLSFQRDQAAASIGTGEEVGQLVFSSNDGGDYALITARSDGASSSTSDCPGRLEFSTTADGASSPTERMRIQSSGRKTLFSSDTTHCSSVLSNQGAATNTTLYLGAHTSSGYGTGTISFQVYTNGNVQNTNNSYAGISDIKLKENIVDATSQWDDIKALRPVNYNFKAETGQQTHTQLGLIAQEVELVSPGLVTESPDRDAEGNDLGTVTKSVNYSVLYMKAVKALQEAMERIETLEAKVAALESA